MLMRISRQILGYMTSSSGFGDEVLALVSSGASEGVLSVSAATSAVKSEFLSASAFSLFPVRCSDFSVPATCSGGLLFVAMLIS